MHARAIRHETEDSAKVEQALRAVVGDASVERSRTEGHFGNVIEVLESTVKDEGQIVGVLARMTPEDRETVTSTLGIRTDDSCHVFLRLDKQSAYAGELRLSDGEDVVAVRIKVRAFPAKAEVAATVMKSLLEEILQA
jgi:RNA binding exosome subunit